MQLDFMQFLSKLEKISPVSLKSSPDREYVEGYVKAYYMPESVMEEWLQKHSVSCVVQYSGFVYRLCTVKLSANRLSFANRSTTANN